MPQPIRKIATFLILSLLLSLSALGTAIAQSDSQIKTQARSLQAGSTISGKVVDNSGNPLADIRVEACLPDACQTPRLHLPFVQSTGAGSRTVQVSDAAPLALQNTAKSLNVFNGIYTATTNASGVYLFTNLSSGNYRLMITGKSLILMASVPPDAANQNFTCGNCVRPLPSEMVFIPAGPFQMGCLPNDTVCNNDEKPLHTITLDAYSIDKYEVTNARYAACVSAGVCSAPRLANSSTRSPYYGNPTYNNYPAIYVNWNQAATFCAWDGKRLPTEAEWEKAARGSSDTRIFPWGNQRPDCTRANHDYANGYTFQLCVGDTDEVGSYSTGASPNGAMEMSGNVYEWVSDWYHSDYYNISPPTNPTGPATGDYRVQRGGSWNDWWGPARTSYRSGKWVPTSNRNDLGFRCARSN